jgi:hypothetical protein
MASPGYGSHPRDVSRNRSASKLMGYEAASSSRLLRDDTAQPLWFQGPTRWVPNSGSLNWQIRRYRYGIRTAKVGPNQAATPASNQAVTDITRCFCPARSGLVVLLRH